MIQTEGLTKYFDDFMAVDHIDLVVPQGKVLVLLGKNGAGKTTTVRMLTSILRPSAGRAWVGGFDVVEQADQVRATVGVLTEHHGLYGRMNSGEYLSFFGSLYGLTTDETRRRTNPLLEQFGLAEAGKKRLGEYSKGMRQKLAIVRALVHSPAVILLDEPTSAMDPESARIVRDAIMQLRRDGRTILMCTHNLYEGEELADGVAIIQNGRILLNDTVENVKLNLLGPAEYEAVLARPVEDALGDLPGGVELRSRGADWLRFRVADPGLANPEILRALLERNIPVVTFREVPRSLEQAFLGAIRQTGEEVSGD